MKSHVSTHRTAIQLGKCFLSGLVSPILTFLFLTSLTSIPTSAQHSVRQGARAIPSHVHLAPRRISRVSHSAAGSVRWLQSPQCRSSSCRGHHGSAAEPFGAALQTSMDLQVMNGQQAQLVLYQYDFVHAPNVDVTQLNRAGRRKLERLVSLLQTTGLPLIIEPSDISPDVTEARRMQVVNVLESELWYAGADAQVVVRKPPSSGIRGGEAIIIDRNRLGTTRTQGAPGSSNSSGFSPSNFGSSGAGFSGARSSRNGGF